MIFSYMNKDKKLSVKTISLPATLARRADRVAREEGRTVSELFRESFRLYEREYFARPAQRAKGAIEWKKIKRTLDAVGKSGKQKSLSKFVIRDRLSH